MPARRKPNAMKILHGARKHTINTNEPKLAGTPDCPEWLPPLAQEEWHRLISEFGHLNLIAKSDQAALAAYCQSFALWRQASAEVEQHGLLIKEPIVSRYSQEISGYRLKKNPAATVLQQERAAMLAAGRLFGFDPSSRNSLQVPDAPPKSDHSDTDLSNYSWGDDESVQ